MNAQATILIVDDDPDIRMLLAEYLEGNGCDTVTAADGAGMWQMLDTHAVDLIVLDLNLPGKDGLTLCRELRVRSDMPVIMLTARDATLDRIVGLEMGADDYLGKPFEPRELLSRIRTVLRRTHAASGKDPTESGLLHFAGWTLVGVAGAGMLTTAGRDRILVRRRVPPAEDIRYPSQPRAQPRSDPEHDPGARCRSVRPFDRLASQPSAPEAGRGCPRAADHQDRAQRRLCAGNPGQMKIKSFFRSMGGRVFILLIAGVIASAVLALALAAYAQREMIAQIRNRHAAERVEQLVLTLEAAPVASRPAIAAIAQKYGARADFSAPATIPGAVADGEFVAALTRALGDDRHIVALQREGDDCPVRTRAPMQNSGPLRCRTVFLTLTDGSPIRLDVASPSDRALPPFNKDFMPYMLVFVLCVAVLAFLVALMATRPLRKLAQAANNLGHDIERPPLAEDAGPTEVREAAAAFNDMQLRIRNYIQERTHMLAAIAHDLQTPLTRMRLRLEKVADEELKEKLITDLSATQAMVKEGLELAQWRECVGDDVFVRNAGPGFADRQHLQRCRRSRAGSNLQQRSRGFGDGASPRLAALPAEPDRKCRQVRPVCACGDETGRGPGRHFHH